MDGLILVDLQNDFMPGGALAVAGGDATVPVANALAPLFDTVVATRDWHPPNHGSFVTAHAHASVGDLTTLGGLTQVVWPVHCVQETHGAAFHDELDMASIDEIVSKGTDPNIDSYSAFFDNGHRRATGLEPYLRGRNVDRLYILGLATDYCVKYTALDARQQGFETWMVEDGCRGVELNPGDVDAAINEMRNAGVHMVESGELLGRGRQTTD
jgi:nicotinamidase/pyrazinamidase